MAPTRAKPNSTRMRIRNLLRKGLRGGLLTAGLPGAFPRRSSDNLQCRCRRLSRSPTLSRTTQDGREVGLAARPNPEQLDTRRIERNRLFGLPGGAGSQMHTTAPFVPYVVA